MRFGRFTILHLSLAVLVVALVLASMVEQQTSIGQSSTRSPDGNWCLNLELIEYSTLFKSRRVLDADIRHSTNQELEVLTSVPLNEADARTISNQHPDYPIVWSDDSSTVKYWINEELEDFIKIDVSGEEFKFQRGLYSTSVIETIRADK